MTEKWTRWEPMQGLVANYCLDETLSKVERIVYNPPVPFQDSSDTPEYMRKLLSNAALTQESSHKFFILLSDINNGKNRVLITFDEPSSFRCVIEKYKSNMISELQKKHGFSFYDWTFFKVEGSSYLTWLIDQSYEIIDSKHHLQFSFITSNAIVDVVTIGEPKIELISE